MTAEVVQALVDNMELDDRSLRLWTVAQLARAAQLSEWAIRAALRRGELYAVRRGRLLRVPDAEARRFLGCK